MSYQGIREANIKLLLGKPNADGTPNYTLQGELVLVVMGKEIRSVCPPEEVIAIHEALLSGPPSQEQEEQEEERSEDKDFYPDRYTFQPEPQQVVLGETKEGPEDSFQQIYGKVFSFKKPPESKNRRAAGPPRVIAQDEGGNPILDRSVGVDPLEELGAKSPGENGVDLL